MRRVWTPEEDERLRAIVKESGARSWSSVARRMGNIKPSQCHERWHNHLSPQVRKDVWTAAEDAILLERAPGINQVRTLSACRSSRPVYSLFACDGTPFLLPLPSSPRASVSLESCDSY